MNGINAVNLNMNLLKAPMCRRILPPQREVIKDFVVEVASSIISDDSPITDKWLSKHPEVAAIIARNPGFARYLNENPDQAERLMEGRAEAREVIKEAAMKGACALIDDDLPITDEWLSEHPGAAAIIAKHPGFAYYLNENPDQAERLMEGRAEAREVVKEAALEGACALIDDDSPITDEWLSEHPGAAAIIVRNPRFARYLNENPDQAERVMEGGAEAKEVIKEVALEGACALIDDDSPITDEWLSEHLGAAAIIAKHPGFAYYLNENPDQAEKFIRISV